MKVNARITKILSTIAQRHGRVKTSTGTTAERSYRNFISTITKRRVTNI